MNLSDILTPKTLGYVVTNIVVWNLVFYLMDTFVFHDVYSFSPVIGLIIPAVVGILEPVIFAKKE